MSIHNPLIDSLRELSQAAQEVEVQCWQWDQLARELAREFEGRYRPGGDNDWMSGYMERLKRYAPKEGVTK